uniref:Uncharacterized protein n=1 Tax=Helianthus annuus TaxID=4232 RepID=A0A251TYJ1_HELAN
MKMMSDVMVKTVMMPINGYSRYFSGSDPLRPDWLKCSVNSVRLGQPQATSTSVRDSVKPESPRVNSVGLKPGSEGSVWFQNFNSSDSLVRIGQLVSVRVFGSTAGQLSQDGQTWSTVVSQDPECFSCTLASSLSWNDITKSR